MLRCCRPQLLAQSFSQSRLNGQLDAAVGWLPVNVHYYNGMLAGALHSGQRFDQRSDCDTPNCSLSTVFRYRRTDIN